ncbi:hypothetical protein Are01nite_88550 [Actinoplanes regularis]|nr:hypothetical protein Are01nite_88550 [Actinoplanes regularis]
MARRRLDQEKTTTDRRLQPHENTAARLVRAAMQASAAVAEAAASWTPSSESCPVSATLPCSRCGRPERGSGCRRFTAPPANSSSTPGTAKKTGNQLEHRRNVSLTKWIPDDTPHDLGSLRPFATSTAADTTPQTWKRGRGR